MINTKKFYLPVLALAFVVGTAMSCEKAEGNPDENQNEQEQEEQSQGLTIEYPSDTLMYDLSVVTFDGIKFKWTNDNEETPATHKLKFSLNKDLSDGKIILIESLTKKGDFILPCVDIDRYLSERGVEPEQEAVLYWQISTADPDFTLLKTAVKTLKVKRMAWGPYVPEEYSKAEKMVVNVAIVYEDPYVPGTTKRFHEKCTVRGGAHWNDPAKQAKEFEWRMEEASHGVIDYNVVKEVWVDDRVWCYDPHDLSNGKKYLSLDTLVNHIFPTNVDGQAYYDYVGMCKEYGFDKMADNDEIEEVWVYNHPACGMNETRFLGKDGFWLNSTPILPPACTNTELITVVFCNYERTVDLAIHSNGHRYESIMKELYGRWDYDPAKDLSDLNNWEIYSGYRSKYKKIEEGYAQIGDCHHPCNVDANMDYIYWGGDYINTYADAWNAYPVLDFSHENARNINAQEWGADQMGYMMWFFGHIPHFKGINPSTYDKHLNNWWYYIMEWKKAKKEENVQRKLLKEKQALYN